MNYHNPAKTAFFKGWRKREKYAKAMMDRRRTKANRETAQYQARGRMLALDVLACEADFRNYELLKSLVR